ncbi:hypothetical protein KUTeg_020900 [Tegillarca granosa]|uniref:RING-CH-type domain-containing protein n=1 Tax=Tegillarca granosa TaxID=220873 RepID=A0ABQ9E992_TEGGR|nr:hypothetical protein KUTeg_020900 [Tegillarca granosa]
MFAIYGIRPQEYFGNRENLKQSECSCRGTLAKIHVSCLHEWVRYRGTNRCEICHTQFQGVTPPETPGIMDREASRLLAIAAISWQLDRSRPFTRKKRAAMAAVIVFLVIVTCVTSLLTVSADREYESVSTSPFSSKEDVDESNVVFSICIAFTFFCATMTIGLILIWVGMECCFQMQRRAILRTASARLLRNINTI